MRTPQIYHGARWDADLANGRPDPRPHIKISHRRRPSDRWVRIAADFSTPADAKEWIAQRPNPDRYMIVINPPPHTTGASKT